MKVKKKTNNFPIINDLNHCLIFSVIKKKKNVATSGSNPNTFMSDRI